MQAAEKVPTLKLVRAFDKGIDVEKTAVYGLAISGDDKQVLIGGDGASGVVTLWNIESGQTDQYFDIFTEKLDGYPLITALSPDGNVAAVSTSMRKVFFIDLSTGDVLKVHENSSFVWSIRFSPDSHLFAMLDIEGSLTIVDCAHPDDAEPFAVKTKYKAHDKCGSVVCWSRDAKRLATASGDKAVRLWDVESHKEILHLQHDEWVWGLGYSSDAKLLVTGTGGGLAGFPLSLNYEESNDNSIRLWDATDGKLIRTMPGHTNRVVSLRFTPDNKYLVSGSHDKTVRAWIVETGKEIAQVEGKSWVWSLDMAANSNMLVVGGGAVYNPDRTWSVFPEERVRVFQIEE